MGTSTVSGPFRSQNGFQELVDGEWVPVSGGGSPLSLTTTGTSGPATLVGSNLNIPNYATGGGGGGGNTTIIPWVGGNSPTIYTLPAFTAPGQTASFAWEFHNSSGSGDYLEVTMAPMPGVDVIFFFAITSDSFNNISQNTGMNSVGVANPTMATSLFTATFVSTIVYSGDTYAIIGITAANLIGGG
jgi:hypothetical protein